LEGAFALPPGFSCPVCGYRSKLDDPYGCPNCLGEGLSDQ